MRTIFQISRFRWLAAVPCMVVVLCALQAFGGDTSAAKHWYKGNTHAHTHWSDGDELPELVVDWFKTHGYQFLAVSDHDRLMEGDGWASMDRERKPVQAESVENAAKKFGANSVVQRKHKNEREIKLKTFAELSGLFNEPGKFLLIQTEEISTWWLGPDQPKNKKHPCQNVHINAINVAELVKRKVGPTPTETIDINLALVREQAERLHRPIIAQVNHPNWKDYDISAEDLAASTARFFEVCNGGGSGVHNGGDDIHPSTDKMWDVVNTIRIAKMNGAPLYGVAADDSHNYHKFSMLVANPGRGYVMVHAAELTPNAIVEAMQRGDFYSSTGVTLRDVDFDAKTGVYKIAVQAEPGVHYTIDFVGTLQGADTAYKTIAPPANARSKRAGHRYSPEIGKVLASVSGTSATYKLTGKELYVRAIIRSDKAMDNPIGPDSFKEQAWCQPVGWQH